MYYLHLTFIYNNSLLNFDGTVPYVQEALSNLYSGYTTKLDDIPWKYSTYIMNPLVASWFSDPGILH